MPSATAGKPARRPSKPDHVLIGDGVGTTRRPGFHQGREQGVLDVGDLGSGEIAAIEDRPTVGVVCTGDGVLELDDLELVLATPVEALVDATVRIVRAVDVL